MRRTPQIPTPKYYVCKFMGIGSKRNDFLVKTVELMESKGFMLSQGWEWLRKQLELEVLERDIVLFFQKWEIGLRARKINDELKVSYRFSREKFRRKKWLFLIEGIGLAALFVFSMALSSYEGLWNLVSNVIGEGATWVVLYAPAIYLLLLFLISRVRRKPIEEAIEELMMEIVKSLGGTIKYLSMETTLEPEDFLFADETIEYQSLGKFQLIKKMGKWIQKPVFFDFCITSQRILLLGIEVPLDGLPKEYALITERIGDIVKIDHETKGSVVRKDILCIETKSRKIDPLEGEQHDIEDILQELMDHPETNPEARKSIRHEIQERIVKVEPGQDLYKLTLEAYMSTIGGGRQRFEMEIQKIQERGLTREQAIQKMAQKLRMQ